MIKDTTINIDGVDYTFDSKGVCQNPPTRSALSSPNSIQSQQSDNSTPNEIQEQQPDSSTDTDSNNENENIINEDSEVGASIYSIIRRKNKHSYNSVYDKELIQLKKYFMGILY